MSGLSQCALVLEVLADGRAHSSREFFESAGTLAGHSRVSDLRAVGYDIECRSERDSHTGRLVDVYELRGVPGVPSRFEEQLDAGGAWAAASLLRGMRVAQAGWTVPASAVPPVWAVDAARAEELARVEDELAQFAAQPSLEEAGRLEELERRRRELAS